MHGQKLELLGFKNAGIMRFFGELYGQNAGIVWFFNDMHSQSAGISRALFL